METIISIVKLLLNISNYSRPVTVTTIISSYDSCTCKKLLNIYFMNIKGCVMTTHICITYMYMYMNHMQWLLAEQELLNSHLHL